MMTSLSLTNPGDRTHRVNKDRAEELISKWKIEIESNESCSIETLDLANRVYEVDAAKIICEFLNDKVTQVRTANLPDIIASLKTDDGLFVLRSFSNLLAKSPIERLNLDDNALGIRGIIECRGIISCLSLLHLSLQNNGLDAQSMKNLKNILLDSSNQNGSCVASNLETLKIYNNMIGIEGAKEVGPILRACRNLKYFRYEGCRAQKEGTHAIVQGLADMTAQSPAFQHPLEALLLESSLGCKEEDPISAFCLLLPNLSQLSHLKLYDCGLESTGCDRVLTSMNSLSRLEILEMGQNEMAADNIENLTIILQNNLSTMRVLNLESNELTSLGVELLVNAFRGSNEVAIERLFLSENQIGERGAMALIEAQNDNLLPNLKVLTLDENGFSEETVENLHNSFDGILIDMEDNFEDEDYDDELEDWESNEGGDDFGEEDDDTDDEGEADDLAKALRGVRLTPDDVSL